MTQIVIESGQSLLKAQISHQAQPGSGFDLMYALRMVLYVLVLIKLIELSFLRRKKHNLKERIYRKFIFAHQEILKQFNQDDKNNMEITLNNTLKNAGVAHPTYNKPSKKSKKRVNFIVEKNIYHDPKPWKEDEELYLDIQEKNSLIKLEEGASFEQKKVQDQFQERFSLQEIDEKLQGASTQPSSKMMNENQQSSLNNNEAEQISDLPVDSRLSSRFEEIQQESKINKNQQHDKKQ